MGPDFIQKTRGRVRFLIHSHFTVKFQDNLRVLDNETARKVPALEETQENDFEKDRKFVQRGNLRDTY